MAALTAVSRLRDVLDIELIPLGDRNIPVNTYDMLCAGAAIAPDATALSFFLKASEHKRPFHWSFRQLVQNVTKAANLFRRLGIERGDVVAFVLPNLPETHWVIWGGEAAGIVFAINPLLEAAQIAELLKAGNAKWLVTLAPTPGTDIWDKVLSVVPHVPGLSGILTVGVGPYISGPQGVTFREMSGKADAPGVDVPIKDLRLEMARVQGESLNFQAPKPDDISSYFCTGGTTGLPKIAKRTHFSEAFDAWAMTAFVGNNLGPGRTVFCGLPLFHVNAQLVTGLGPWWTGAHIVLGTPQGYRGDGVIQSFWAITEHFRLNAFSGVPTLYSGLLQVPVDGRDISSLDFALCGAAPAPVELFRAFAELTGVRILEGYGLTEGACTSSVNPPAGDKRVGSIGLRLPYQDMRVLMLNDDGGYVRDAEADEAGVLAINGPNVFAGYVDPVHERGIWIERNGEQWLNTGDLARQDADGYFWLTGRKKELIIRSGHNIDPKLLEEPLHGHPAVALAAAVGRPDAYAGEVPVVYVQLRQDSSITADELLAFAKENIPERAAWPKAVHIIRTLPTTAVGKIFKPALSMIEIEDVVRQEAAAAGNELASLEIVQDSRRGLTALISVRGDAAKLQAGLARYAFPTEFLP
jgi:fatty-acyl-CoA synthase